MTKKKEFFLRQLHGALLNVHQERLPELSWFHDEPIPLTPTNQKFKDTYIDLPVTDILTLKTRAVEVGEDGPLIKYTSQRMSSFACED